MIANRYTRRPSLSSFFFFLLFLLRPDHVKRTFSSPPLTDSTGPIPCHHLPRPSSHLIVATSSGRGPSPTGGPLAYGLRRRLIARLVPPLSLSQSQPFSSPFPVASDSISHLLLRCLFVQPRFGAGQLVALGTYIYNRHNSFCIPDGEKSTPLSVAQKEKGKINQKSRLISKLRMDQGGPK